MIHDISKNRLQGAAPAPNGHDVVNPAAVPARGTNAVNYVTAATDISSNRAGLNGQITIAKIVTLPTSTVSMESGSAGEFVEGTSLIATIAHGLDRVPTLMGFYGQDSFLYLQTPDIIYGTVGAGQAIWTTTRSFADDTNVFLEADVMLFGNMGPVDVDLGTFTYYLGVQTADASDT